MSTGYSHAPLIQVISITTLIFSTAFKVSNVELDLYKVIHGEIWRLITTHLVFRNPAQLIVGLMVLYSLRGFERQMGSKKFGAYLIYCLLASTVLSILFILILDVLMGLSFVPSSGPFFLIYSLMIFYYWHVPALYPIRYSALGLRLSEKSWIYLLAGQLLFSDSFDSILSGASGLIVGYAYIKDFFHIQSYRLPPSVERVFGVFGNLFQAFHMPTASTSTAEAAGSLEMRNMSSSDGSSAVESAAHRSRERRLRNNIDDVTARFRFEDFEEHRGFGVNTTSPFFRPSSSTSVVPPSEDSISSLMGLGFERDVVIRALQSTGNNIEAAANLLLR